MDSQRLDEATGHYSTALSIHPANTHGFFVLRSKVCIVKGSWKDAIGEADQVYQLCLLRVRVVDENPSGNRTCSIVTTGLRDEACGFTSGKTLR